MQCEKNRFFLLPFKYNCTVEYRSSQLSSSLNVDSHSSRIMADNFPRSSLIIESYLAFYIPKLDFFEKSYLADIPNRKIFQIYESHNFSPPHAFRCATAISPIFVVKTRIIIVIERFTRPRRQNATMKIMIRQRFDEAASFARTRNPRIRNGNEFLTRV